MKKVSFWSVLLLIPAIVMPYLLVAAAVSIFLSTKVDFITYFYEEILKNNGLLVVPLLLIYGVVALLCVVLFCVISIKRKVDPVSFSKTVMIFKICLIPGFVLDFLTATVLLVTIFTMLISFIMVIFMCVVLGISAVPAVCAVILAARRKTVKVSTAVAFALLQCVLGVDVISFIVFYIIHKKKSRKQEEAIAEAEEPFEGIAESVDEASEQTECNVL